MTTDSADTWLLLTGCAATAQGSGLVLRVFDGKGVSEARFVPLHTLSSPAEAEMVNDILQQNGIRSVVQSGASDAFSPLFSVMAPGAQVLVDERDFDRANELYSSFFGQDTSPLTGPAFEEEIEESE